MNEVCGLLFRIDRETRKKWLPMFDRSTVRINASKESGGIRILFSAPTSMISSFISDASKVHRTTAKFYQWSDSAQGTKFGLGFGSEQMADKFLGLLHNQSSPLSKNSSVTCVDNMSVNTKSSTRFMENSINQLSADCGGDYWIRETSKMTDELQRLKLKIENYSSQTTELEALRKDVSNYRDSIETINQRHSGELESCNAKIQNLLVQNEELDRRNLLLRQENQKMAGRLDKCIHLLTKYHNSFIAFHTETADLSKECTKLNILSD